MKTKGTKSGFCSGLEWSIAITWLDLTGIHKFSDGRIVRIELATSGVSGTYAGFQVTIISPTNGKIDEKFFAFDDYLPRSERKDGRQVNYPLSAKAECFVVIAHCGWDWYIAVPNSTDAFCVAVEEYVRAFDSI